MADDEGEATHEWLTTLNLALSVLVILAGFRMLVIPEMNLRIALAVATLAGAAGAALLATGSRQRSLQIVSLSIGAIAAVQFGWAVMEPGPLPHEGLRRAIRVLVSLAVVAFVYGMPLVRLVPRGSSWFAAIRRVAVGVAVTAIVSLGLILWLEFRSFDRATGSPVSAIDTAVVAIALVGLAAGLISLAVLPGRDPLFSTEQQRFVYVYASEVVAGLLFAHLYLTNPQLFQDWLKPYWPLVVMGIAFAGTGLSEFFGRLKVNVLSRPLEYTAAFLPVLPVIGFWLLDSDLEYSTTLFIVGVLYLFLSLRRGSFVYSAAAAIVGNATLCRTLWRARRVAPGASADVHHSALRDGARRRPAQPRPAERGDAGVDPLLRDHDDLRQLDRRNVPARHRHDALAADGAGGPLRPRRAGRHHAPRAGLFVLGHVVFAALDREHGVARGPQHWPRLALVGVPVRPRPRAPDPLWRLREEAVGNAGAGGSAQEVGEMRGAGWGRGAGDKTKRWILLSLFLFPRPSTHTPRRAPTTSHTRACGSPAFVPLRAACPLPGRGGRQRRSRSPGWLPGETCQWGRC